MRFVFECSQKHLRESHFLCYELHQTYFIFEHKTILTWLSWIVFAVLLAGRYFLGWRKKKALAWFWAGIVFLAVAYLVYRFILDAMIH